jgi:hypothetical protein
MKTLLLGILILSACGGIEAPPDFVTTHGVFVYNNGLTYFKVEDMNATEELLLQNLSPIIDTRKAAECLSHLSAHAKPAPWDCTHDGKNCGGLQTDNDVYVAPSWVGLSDLCGDYAHEMTHYLEQCVLGDGDASHSNKVAWEAVSATTNALCTPDVMLASELANQAASK